MLNPCIRKIYFLSIKNIVVTDGISWTDGSTENTIEVGQEGS